MINEQKILLELKLWGTDLNLTLERFLDDKIFYIDTLKIFSTDSYFNSIGEKLNAGDYESAIEDAFALKGVSANLGLENMYNEINIFLDLAKSEDYALLNTQYKKILKTQKKLCDILK